MRNPKQIKINSLWAGVRILILWRFLYFSPSLTFAAGELNNSILFRALSDELNRNVNRLQLENQAKLCSIMEPNAKFEIGKNKLKSKVIEFSKIFNKYPPVLKSYVTFKVRAGNQYFLT